MKITLIGGSGFVGTRLLDLLRQGNYELQNIDKQQSHFFPDVTVICDVRNREKLTALLKGTDVVILLAAEHRDDVLPFSLYYDVNVGGMQNTLAAMEANGVKRIVFTSSVAVYGLNKENPKEEYPKDPFNHYGKSKWLAEMELEKWYREHPDWAFTIPGRKPVRARYQLVLDYSRKEVVDGIFTQIAKVLDETKADYVKMDMNRHLTDVWSKTAGEQNQGAILHRYMLGVYDFLERLHERYPALLIEGCSGGGGRFDAGMLYYTPQIWCSDNTDAIERVKIQYGTSFAYPSCTVGSHVSAVPNHQTGRTTELATRAAVAMAGSFGYELDLNLLTEEEKEQVRAQIKNYHRFEMLIRQGRYYRLTDVWQKKEYAAWEYCRPDGSEALVTVVTLDTQCNPATEYVKLRGLGEDKKYRVEVVGMQTGGENGQRINGTPNSVEPEYYTGAQLVHAGLPVPRLGNEYKSWQVYVKEV